jgi:hypothetical protein
MLDYSAEQELVQFGEGSLPFLEARLAILINNFRVAFESPKVRGSELVQQDALERRVRLGFLLLPNE